ncbi:MAG: hypothetical protein A2231_02170 [Candidatus Firestonebacteria bacterium RIFOXYA2_FULL_40_8]|nr:MAG: hypothetical protein A2231_02170 [Candidatus Firestonebacteria bacterium RIFOXYA2_FULL_40_8]
MIVPYKDNWEETEARMRAWWERKIIKRIPMAIHVGKGKKVNLPKATDAETLYCDGDFLKRELKIRFDNSYFVAETIPNYSFMFGYAFPGVFMGQTPVMDMKTVWFKHSEELLESMPLDFNTENKLWRKLMKLESELLEVSMQGLPVFIQPMDVISMILGAEKTCFELIERPELIKSCRDRLTVTFKKMYEEAYSLTAKKYDGSTCWLPVWSPGKYFPLQCDFSCMISEDMFEEFVVPELEDLTNFLDNSIYHLDGVNALHHLPRLLKFKKINAIQWVPGAGKPEGMYWKEVFKQILESGKGVYASIPAGEVEEAVKTLPREGLWIDTSVGTLEEANELIKIAEKYN